jgi:ferredoxin
MQDKMVTKKLYLYFPKSEIERPIVYNLIREYNLIVNIIRSKVTPNEEGYLSLEITGKPEDIEKGFDYLKNLDVEIHIGNVGVIWDASRCTHCGNCVVHCPTEALHFKNTATREIDFDESKCVECLACLTNCPYGVCTSLV